MLNPPLSFENDQNEWQQSYSTFLSDVHCHTNISSNRNKDTNKIVSYKLIAVLILCVLFMIAEIVGGILANSISIQTDSAHLAADIAGFFFSILAIYVSKKGLNYNKTIFNAFWAIFYKI